MEQKQIERFEHLNNKFHNFIVDVSSFTKSKKFKRTELPIIQLKEEWIDVKDFIKIFSDYQKTYPQFEKIELIPYSNMGRLNIECVGLMKELSHEHSTRIQQEEEYIEYLTLKGEYNNYMEYKRQEEEYFRLKQIFEPKSFIKK